MRLQVSRTSQTSSQSQQQPCPVKDRQSSPRPLPSAVKDETGEEDDEEVVRVPEDLKVAAPDDLHGGSDDEDEGQSDDDTGEASDGGEDEVGGDLLWILRHKKEKCVVYKNKTTQKKKKKIYLHQGGRCVGCIEMTDNRRYEMILHLTLHIWDFI